MIRVLITYDVDGWAFHNRALALAKHAPDGFTVRIAKWTDRPPTDDIDIVFNLDPMMPGRLCSKPTVVSWNSDRYRKQAQWPTAYRNCDFMIFNNKDCWMWHGKTDRTCCIANGVDTDIFHVTSPIAERPERVFWTGSSNPNKRKGLDILNDCRDKLSALGFEVAAFPVDSAVSRPFTPAQMVEQYNSSGYVLCLSESDATPNTSLEGMACGCALVTTRVGNAVEFDWPDETCQFIERSSQGLIDGLTAAREHRVAIATSGANLIHSQWSYGHPGHRAAPYFALFQSLVDGRTPPPFSYDDLPK